MAATVESREIPDWLNNRSARVLGPSWLLSAVTHLAVAWIVWQVAQTPGCQARRGEQISEGREVGIFVRERGPEDPREPGASPPAAAAAATTGVGAATETTPQRSAAPSLPPSLAGFEPPRAIGVGPAPEFVRKAAQAAGGPLVQNGGPAGRGDFGSGTGSKSGRGSGNGTSMYGIAAKGKKFVYVIDRSSSMTDVLLSAKNELMASLRRLDESQEFQVVFFNDRPRELKHRFSTFHGTPSDLQLVESQLADFSASDGTNRLLALKKALEFRPDVIYFLTDAEDEMTSAQRAEIRGLLRGAQINCIEFGQGLPVTGPDGKPARNFLHKLAEESGGGYRYFDITGGASR
ncbi:MAG TPA: hypothetical protein VM452_13250 [Caulifigura sp.]|jgi:hypothetical protein|nr:hypothetical protein [Caulifigura sp.]